MPMGLCIFAVIEFFFFMRAHIHYTHGLPQSVNNYLAVDGFQQMGWEIVPYTNAELVRDHNSDEIVVGHIAAVRASLRALGLAVPAALVLSQGS